MSEAEKKARAEKKVREWVKKMNEAEAAGDMDAYNKAVEQVQHWEREAELAGWI